MPPPPRTGPNPRETHRANLCLSRNRGTRRSRMKTLLSDIPQDQPCWRHPRPVKLGFAGTGGPTLLPRACPPRSHHNSLFTLQSAPPHSPAADVVIFAKLVTPT